MTNPVLATIGFTKTDAERFFEAASQGWRAPGSRRSASQHIPTRRLCKGVRPYLLSEKDRGHPAIPISPCLLRRTTCSKPSKGTKETGASMKNRFLSLMAERKIEDRFRPEALDGACLLCSEDKPQPLSSPTRGRVPQPDVGQRIGSFATFDPGFGQLENVTSSSSFRLRLPQSVAPSEGLLPT